MFDVNNLQVAKPCHVGWETMSGDERSRHCAQCQLNVYNIAGMTAEDAQNLIENREGRICIRLVRRADGTVLTKDCPVGIRKYRARAARYASAALATIFGVFSVSYGQQQEWKAPDNSKPKIVRTNIGGKNGKISGVVVDAVGQIISDVRITLIAEKGNARKARTDKDGQFRITNIRPRNKYRMNIEAAHFEPIVIEEISVAAGDNIRIDLEMRVRTIDEIVGIYAKEPVIDTGSSTVETVVSSDKIRRIPH